MLLRVSPHIHLSNLEYIYIFFHPNIPLPAGMKWRRRRRSRWWCPRIIQPIDLVVSSLKGQDEKYIHIYLYILAEDTHSLSVSHTLPTKFFFFNEFVVLFILYSLFNFGEEPQGKVGSPGPYINWSPNLSRHQTHLKSHLEFSPIQSSPQQHEILRELHFLSLNFLFHFVFVNFFSFSFHYTAEIVIYD